MKNNFDGLRLLGALLVLFSHEFALSGRHEPEPLAGHTYGNVGVLIFFAISGYLVAGSWARDPNVPRFALRRVLRMGPGLVVACLVASFIAAALHHAWPRFAHYVLLEMPRAKLEADGFFPGNANPVLNGSLWTIRYEVECYAILACLGVVAGRHLGPTIGVVALFALVACGHLGANALTQFGPCFALGAVLHFYPRILRLAPVLFLLGLACVAVRLPELGLILVVSAGSVYVGTRSWPVLRDAGRLGDLSYGIYIYAWPVQQVIVWKLGASSAYLELAAISLGVTLVFAYASWHLVESVALRMKPRRDSGELPVRPLPGHGTA